MVVRRPLSSRTLLLLHILSVHLSRDIVRALLPSFGIPRSQERSGFLVISNPLDMLSQFCLPFYYASLIVQLLEFWYPVTNLTKQGRFHMTNSY